MYYKKITTPSCLSRNSVNLPLVDVFVVTLTTEFITVCLYCKQIGIMTSVHSSLVVTLTTKKLHRVNQEMQLYLQLNIKMQILYKFV